MMIYIYISTFFMLLPVTYNFVTFFYAIASEIQFCDCRKSLVIVCKFIIKILYIHVLFFLLSILYQLFDIRKIFDTLLLTSNSISHHYIADILLKFGVKHQSINQIEY
jgi:hypothetical protein